MVTISKEKTNAWVRIHRNNANTKVHTVLPSTRMSFHNSCSSLHCRGRSPNNTTAKHPQRFQPRHPNRRYECLNCGSKQHSYRFCPCPHTSFGIIMFRRSSSASDGLEYLMICRRHTFGYTEFVRAQFDIRSFSFTKQLLSEMTNTERKKIHNWSFRCLWNDVWQTQPSRRIPTVRTDYSSFASSSTQRNRRYEHEYRKAKAQFESLRNSNMFRAIYSSLKDSTWKCPEWEFPKGKRNPGEHPRTCAVRELGEETGLWSKHAFKILPHENSEYPPFEELYQGTDGRKYRHLYYLAEYNQCRQGQHQGQMPATEIPSESDHYPHLNHHNPIQTREVSAVEWLSLPTCMQRIRSYNVAKRKLLFRIHSLLTSSKSAALS